LPAFVVALGGALTMIVASQYRQYRGSGAAPEMALEQAYGELHGVMPAVAVAIAGFVALIPSDVELLRDAGIAAAVGLSIALAGIAVVLPAALVWSESLRPVRLPARDEVLARVRALAGGARRRAAAVGRGLAAGSRRVTRRRKRKERKQPQRKATPPVERHEP
jgi:predicted RND superfamily exporter protein